MKTARSTLLFFLLLFTQLIVAQDTKVTLGVDLFFQGGHQKMLRGKKVGIITNQTGVDSNLKPTWIRLQEGEKRGGYQLKALFSPEHGLDGSAYAAEKMGHGKKGKIPLYSLHGKTRRPTKEMLDQIDVLIFDIQDIGCRSYTYLSTLCYAMEEAAKHHKKVIVFDRPNPMGGEVVDGPMLQERSFIGYLNIPYCHGMTIGELAHFFNEEYQVGCDLQVIPMKGWKREMTFADTGLTWIPTSPHIPEADTPFFYTTTGLLGELGLVSIGVGYTLPFKLVGAPWIDGELFARELNQQKLPGVSFSPFSFKPFYGAYKGESCQGVLIAITDKKSFKPLSTQYTLLGVLKAVYPKVFMEKTAKLSSSKKHLFSLANGNKEMVEILSKEKYVTWRLIGYEKKQREQFLKKRKKYLAPHY